MELIKVKYLSIEDHTAIEESLTPRDSPCVFHPLPKHSLALLLEVFSKYAPC